MKKQILIIGGGEVFDSYDDYIKFLKEYRLDLEKTKKKKWKRELQKDLGDDWEVIYPDMPAKWNVKYLEWKLWFEKFLPHLRDDVILLGNSLGGIFLSKYLSENDFPVKIKAVFLVAPPFDEKDCDYSLGDFVLSASLKKFEDQCDKIFIYFSKDDPVVPFADLEKYMKALPSAKKVVFEDKGHFNLEEFPEIVEKIKEIAI